MPENTPCTLEAILFKSHFICYIFSSVTCLLFWPGLKLSGDIAQLIHTFV